MNIRQWQPSCCMRADMTKVMVAFRNFANAPKNSKLHKQHEVTDSYLFVHTARATEGHRLSRLQHARHHRIGLICWPALPTLKVR